MGGYGTAEAFCCTLRRRSAGPPRMGPGNDDPDRVRSPRIANVRGPAILAIRSNSLWTLLPFAPSYRARFFAVFI